MAGYSGRPLVEKLGIAEGTRLLLAGAVPEGFLGTDELPGGVRVARRAGGSVDVIVVFTTSEADLRRRLPSLCRSLAADGGLWVAWPKRASGVATDLTEDVVRAIALEGVLVDNKVCAIDDVWSGLRLVVRREARAGWNA